MTTSQWNLSMAVLEKLIMAIKFISMTKWVPIPSKQTKFSNPGSFTTLRSTFQRSLMRLGARLLSNIKTMGMVLALPQLTLWCQPKKWRKAVKILKWTTQTFWKCKIDWFITTLSIIVRSKALTTARTTLSTTPRSIGKPKGNADVWTATRSSL